MDGWVTIKIKKSIKEKLDNGIKILEKEKDLEGIKISYSYFINRIYEKWLEL